ncbi:ExbD/TolR family protein [Pseudoalteromonas denitrificans]|uniref:Biopolymer transport protein ExbD n=1 Tax=Pseudoalteromonas denitrificans DSM 6059 TaxID=1123010 RepID=A0A1I1SVS9_9GAMM|nr:biopolymer transporter ExbD [Pseudoalteromonas denitrificans]SFD48003.1 Biopolymer transport protein ExbD [Pseudoalteromonas denitrificans DSM 6059]
MKKSVRALRMERHHKRMKKTSKLSLVSLMDIFTILVFFLIVNSSSVQVIESNKTIKLPASVAKSLPKETLLLLVNDKDLMLQGKKLIAVSEVLHSNQETISVLLQELAYHKAKKSRASAKNKSIEGAITIMGDKEIEYKLLKKILLTCSNAGFGDIALAVEKTQEQIE